MSAEVPTDCEYCQRAFIRDWIKLHLYPQGWTASRMSQERIPRVPCPVGFYYATHFLCFNCDNAMESLRDYCLGIDP